MIESVAGGVKTRANARPGTGKTTIVLGLARRVAPRQVIQLTYNAALRLEVQQKARRHGLANLTVHTYHSLAVSYFGTIAHTDEGLMRALRRAKAATMEVASGMIESEFDSEPSIPDETGFDAPDEPDAPKALPLLICDEVQDMTPLYFELVQHCFSYAPDLLLGDEDQGVYAFKGASVEFLTDADRIWGATYRTLVIRETFRCARPICEFINREFLGGEERLIAATNKAGAALERIYDSNPAYAGAQLGTEIANEILKYRVSNADDFFILAPSLRMGRSTRGSARSPLAVFVREIEHTLVRRGIPVYFPLSDDGALSEDEMRGKVAFATYHAAKGRERKCVFVLCADEDYRFYNRDPGALERCPPPLYVALTRAQRLLVLAHMEAAPGVAKAALPFRPGAGPLEAPTRSIRTPSITDLTRWASLELVEKIDAVFELEHEAATEIAIPSSVTLTFNDGRKLQENIAAITGVLVPIHFYAAELGRSIDEFLPIVSGSSETQEMALAYAARHSGAVHRALASWSAEQDLHHRLSVFAGVQSWISPAAIDATNARLRARIGPLVRPHIEHYVECERYHGRADLVSGDTLWELKYTTDLGFEHKLQLLLYAECYLDAPDALDATPQHFKLLNIRTGEQWRLRSGCNEAIAEIINVALAAK